MSTTLVGITTRPITMGITDRDTVVRHIEQVPTGTEVYVTRINGGVGMIRVCGTLLTQDVHLSSSIQVV